MICCHPRVLGPARNRVATLMSAWLLLLWANGAAIADDVIEFLSGATSDGTVVQILKSERKVIFEAKVADRTIRRTYPYSAIHAVTFRGKRYVLNELHDDEPAVRSPQQIEAIIERVGSTDPDWLSATPLEYPNTLDLTWPIPAPEPWNNQKNVGQFIWDRVNPNQNQWKRGIKLMYHLLSLAEQKGDDELANRVMKSLASMYFRFFQDYPRAAYWWRKANVSRDSLDGIGLAECYFRMGSKQMAMQALETKRIRIDTIKLLATMGNPRRAVELADVYASQVRDPTWALLAAGDACRSEQNYTQAIAYYQRVLKLTTMRNEDYERRAKDRATQSIDAIRQFELLDISKLADGEYAAESMAYEGPLAVTVSVKSGRIEAVEVTKHKEKQYYSALRDVPEQIIKKQSLKEVDATSRATITAEAIVSATAKALSGEIDSSGR